MSVLNTALDARSPAYLRARSIMLERLGELTCAVGALTATPARTDDADATGQAPGRLPARERIELLVDRDTPLLELSPTVDRDGDRQRDAGVVTAIGLVEGQLCAITADSAVAGAGLPSPYAIWKVRRAVEIAQANGLALISLCDRTGQSQVSGFGQMFATGQTRKHHDSRGELRIPMLAVILGAGTGPLAATTAPDQHRLVRPATRRSDPFTPGRLGHGVFDHEIVVGPRPAGHSTTAPALLRAARCRQPGPGSLVATDDTDAIRLARMLLARLTRGTGRPGAAYHATCPDPDLRTPGSAQVPPPRHAPSGLLAVAPADAAAPFDPREILARILDDSWFDDFDPGYGSALCAGWGAIHGHRVAVLADCQGPLGSAEVGKATQFIQISEGRPAPLLLLRGCGGHTAAQPVMSLDRTFWPQGPIEAAGGARVPQISLTVRATGPDPEEPHFRFCWPGSLADNPDDGTIDPRDTRTVLGLCLAVLAHGSRMYQI